jgi:hypothetical protein
MFAYETAQTILTQHFEKKKRELPAVYRAWVRLLIVVEIIAKTDFRKQDEKSARADAWQEIEAAAKGFGEALPLGAVQDIYLAYPEDDYDEAIVLLERAFAEAWKATPKKYKSLYPAHTRAWSVCRMGEDRYMHMPCRGARVEVLIHQADPKNAKDIIGDIDNFVAQMDENEEIIRWIDKPEPVNVVKPRFEVFTGGKA